MRIVLLGPPGAGKGTLAHHLQSLDGSVPISTGDLLRAAVQAGTPLGKLAEAAMHRGDLVPDQLIMGLMEERLRGREGEGFLLDGFPRTIPQAVSLDLLLKRQGLRLDLVVNLDVPEDVVLDRLTTRRTCANPACHEIYNLRSNPPAEGGTCRVCGHPVVQRDDETVEAIAHRLEVYHALTAPLVGHYDRASLLLTVRALDTHAIAQAIQETLALRLCADPQNPCAENRMLSAGYPGWKSPEPSAAKLCFHE
jgi:adenylate kinase